MLGKQVLKQLIIFRLGADFTGNSFTGGFCLCFKLPEELSPNVEAICKTLFIQYLYLCKFRLKIFCFFSVRVFLNEGFIPLFQEYFVLLDLFFRQKVEIFLLVGKGYLQLLVNIRHVFVLGQPFHEVAPVLNGHSIKIDSIFHHQVHNNLSEFF